MRTMHRLRVLLMACVPIVFGAAFIAAECLGEAISEVRTVWPGRLAQDRLDKAVDKGTACP